MRAVESEAPTQQGRVIARSGITLAANYRAALLSGSRSEFLVRIKIVIGQAIELGGWIDRTGGMNTMPGERRDQWRVEWKRLRRVFHATLAVAANRKR